jgi:hypothetical protein
VRGVGREAKREKGQACVKGLTPSKSRPSLSFFYPLFPLTKKIDMSLTAGACARMRTPGFDCGESVVLKVRERTESERAREDDERESCCLMWVVWSRAVSEDTPRVWPTRNRTHKTRPWLEATRAQADGQFEQVPPAPQRPDAPRPLSHSKKRALLSQTGRRRQAPGRHRQVHGVPDRRC